MAPAPKIAVIYASFYGHIRSLAEAVAAGAQEAGAEVTIFQFPEILSDEVLTKMHATKFTDHPVIKTSDLPEFDGFLFGIPTRYGRAIASASAFFDATGGLWAQGALVGKFAGIFTSSASQHGGQETTALSTLPFLAHHGIAYVPIGFAQPNLSDLSEIIGGSAWGAAAIAGGDGSRAVTEKEKAVGTYQGTSFAKFVGTFVAGKSAAAVTPAKSKAIESTDQASGVATTATTAPAAAKALPDSSSSEPQAYSVDGNDASKVSSGLPAAVPAGVGGGVLGAGALASSGPNAGAATIAPVDSEKPAAATTAQPASAKNPAVSKKSGGVFSICCGGNKDNYDS